MNNGVSRMNINKLICVIFTDSAGNFSYFGTDKHVYYYCLNDPLHQPYSKALLSREIKIERIKAREVFNMHTVKLYA
jgi:hypothetical protein